jgi:DNA polymerase-3 subunit gamma/tau
VQYDITKAPLSRIPVEMLFVKLTSDFDTIKTKDILSKIEDIERNMGKEEKQDEDKPSSKKQPEKVIIEEEAEQEEPEDVYDESEMSSLDSNFNKDDFKSIWDKACQSIKRVKTPVGLYISEGEVVSFDDKTLTIGFYPGFAFHRENLEDKANKKLVEDTFSELLGHKVSIKLVEIAAKKKSNLPQVKKNRIKEDSPPEKEEKNNPIISSAQKIFDGLLVNKEKKGYSS